MPSVSVSLSQNTGTSPSHDHGQHRGPERGGRNENFVAGFKIERLKRSQERTGPVVVRESVATAGEGGVFVFQFADYRMRADIAVAQDLENGVVGIAVKDRPARRGLEDESHDPGLGFHRRIRPQPERRRGVPAMLAIATPGGRGEGLVEAGNKFCRRNLQRRRQHGPAGLQTAGKDVADLFRQQSARGEFSAIHRHGLPLPIVMNEVFSREFQGMRRSRQPAPHERGRIPQRRDTISSTP
jgi:hypothetical protein